MNQSEADKINEADKIVHRVEKQWHYPILTKHGFVAETKEAVGFSRSYVYVHPDGRKIKCTTGINADYWSDDPQTNKFGGYWSSLEAHLIKGECQ